MDHFGRFATDVTEIQIRFDTAYIQLRIPAKSVKFCDVFYSVFIRIRQRIAKSITLAVAKEVMAAARAMGSPTPGFCDFI